MSRKGYGKGMSQDDMMLKDECILLDQDDEIIGHASKKDAHVFDKTNPRGLLHRAFSVFLFDSEGRLLLQKRASDKITFPNVWTNTCCSHPLHGYEPNEVDSSANVAKGKVDGVKAAASRKLEHELGIPLGKVKQYKYLTRLHYWAADVVTHGKKSPWGEHEIDYILFAQADVKVKPNPEEVGEIRYVTQEELREMMDPKSGLLWSPWFRIIAEKFLPYWWEDLETTLNSDEFVDYQTIHRFDPTSEHMGGGGNASIWLGTATSPYADTSSNNNKNGNSSSSNSNSKKNGSSMKKNSVAAGLKQGGYGKVQIHKHGKLDQLMRIDEIFAAVWFMYGPGKMPNKVNIKDPDTKFCDDMLGKVSRSFAMVIRQLPKGMCIDILVFYLALRALDTIEDDMEAFKGRDEVKKDHLNNFYRVGLVTEGWSMDDVGEADEKVLLQQYFKVVSVYNRLRPASREVIADIAMRMGQGMASYVGQDLGQGTKSVKDYEKYCHYVAGLVGEGLSRLFTSSGYENESVAAVAKTTANTMGLFLQKTNILRDYLEDYHDHRAWWPQEIWKQYTETNDLGEFAKPEARGRGLKCLNHLVTDALECIPECIEYMQLLKTEEVFRFCAIPQVMAIATLSDLYNNEKVFTGVVKIRKGQTCKLLLDTKSVGGLHKWFNIFARDILSRVPPSDPSAKNTVAICKKIIELTHDNAQKAIFASYMQVLNALAAFALLLSSFFLFKKADPNDFNEISKLVQKLDLPSTMAAFADKDIYFRARLGTFVSSFVFMFVYAFTAAGTKGLRRADP